MSLHINGSDNGLARSQVKRAWPALSPQLVRRQIKLTSHHQQTQRTLLDWLRDEYGIAKPSNRLLALTELDSVTWVGELNRIRGKSQGDG